MVLLFEKLFNVNVKHNFYESGISRDVKILPTKECKQLIKGGKMLFKQTDNGFKIAYKAIDNNTGGGTPLIDLNSNVTFTFALFLSNNAEFLNITDLDVGAVSYSKDKILYFKNNGTTRSLVYSNIDFLRPKIFTYLFPITAADPSTHIGTLKVTDKNGVLVTIPGKNGLPDINFPITVKPDQEGAYKQPIDFKFLPKGMYTFEYSDNTQAPKTEVIYIDTELARQRIFGLLEVEYLAGNLYGIADEYDMEFIRKETQWKYHVVVKTKTPEGTPIVDVDDLKIKDKSNDPVSGSPYEEYDFSKGENTTINGFETAIFTSDQTNIPFFETAKLRLELQGKNNKTLIENLPNPPRDGPSGQQAEIYIYI